MVPPPATEDMNGSTTVIAKRGGHRRVHRVAAAREDPRPHLGPSACSAATRPGRWTASAWSRRGWSGSCGCLLRELERVEPARPRPGVVVDQEAHAHRGPRCAVQKKTPASWASPHSSQTHAVLNCSGSRWAAAWASAVT